MPLTCTISVEYNPHQVSRHERRNSSSIFFPFPSPVVKRLALGCDNRLAGGRHTIALRFPSLHSVMRPIFSQVFHRQWNFRAEHSWECCVRFTHTPHRLKRCLNKQTNNSFLVSTTQSLAVSNNNNCRVRTTGFLCDLQSKSVCSRL